MAHRPTSSLLLFSERLYRLSLFLYPTRYRRDYGPLMVQVFRDRNRDVYCLQGALGVLEWWFSTLLDLVITAFQERRAEALLLARQIAGRLRASIPKDGGVLVIGFVKLWLATLLDSLAQAPGPSERAGLHNPYHRFSGVLLMAGGGLFMVLSLSQLQPGSHYSFHGLYLLSFLTWGPALLLLAAGLFGLETRLAHRLPSWGKVSLKMAAWAAAVGGLAFFAMVVEIGFAVMLGAINVMLVALIVFGLSTVRTRAFARWNGLPILIGLLPFAMILTATGEAYGPQYLACVVIFLFGLCWLLLGYTVQSAKAPQLGSA